MAAISQIELNFLGDSAKLRNVLHMTAISQMEQNFFCKFDESVTQSNVLSFSKTASSIVLSEPVSWREKIFTTQQDDSIIR